MHEWTHPETEQKKNCLILYNTPNFCCSHWTTWNGAVVFYKQEKKVLKQKKKQKKRRGKQLATVYNLLVAFVVCYFLF